MCNGCNGENNKELQVEELVNIQTGRKIDMEIYNSLPENSMLKVKPELWIEWNFEKNDELEVDIYKATHGSNKKVWWICRKCNSEYNSFIYNKIKGQNCSYCAGTKVNHTNSLATLRPDIASQWHQTLNGDKTPHDFTCGRDYLAWWICPKCKSNYSMFIVNRCNGTNCPYCAGKAVNHTNSLASLFPKLAEEWHPTKNGDKTPDKVTINSGQKVWWRCIKGHEWKAVISTRNSGCGCPYCYGRYATKDNNLLNAFPDIAKEWDYEKNKKTPDEYSPKSHYKAWWICPDCESSYDASIQNRTHRMSKCPYCRGRKANHTNCLLTVNPQLAKQWHPTRNVSLTPNDVTANKGIKVWWLCEKGHEWEATIDSRNKGNGCVVCANKKVLIGFNDLWTTNPELAKLLADSEDGYKYVEGSSSVRLDWKCLDCGTIIKNKTISTVNNSGICCPVCSDGISYPEKVMFNLLRQLKIEFDFNRPMEWSDKKLYDFIIPSLNIIIETHGMQHYDKGFENLGGRSLKEEQENDLYKRELALENGVKYYIELDCRKSDFEYIKNNILENKILNDQFDLDNVDWNEINRHSQKSRNIEILSLWNEGLSVSQISIIVKLKKSAVSKIVRNFEKLGLCKYDKFRKNKLI